MMAILANLDKHLEDAGWKLVFPNGAPRNTDLRRNPGPHPHLGLHVDRHVVTARSLPALDNQHCRECLTPIQSDDVGGVCFGCYQEGR